MRGRQGCRRRCNWRVSSGASESLLAATSAMVAPMKMRDRVSVASVAWFLGVVTMLLGSVPVPASAKTFPVNARQDEPDFKPGDGSCATSAGKCTLRAAVQEANNYPDPSGSTNVIVVE